MKETARTMVQITNRLHKEYINYSVEWYKATEHHGDVAYVLFSYGGMQYIYKFERKFNKMILTAAKKKDLQDIHNYKIIK